jgi:hypothetical protein
MGLLILSRAAMSVAALGTLFAAAPSLASASPQRSLNKKLHFGVSSNWSGYALTGFGPYTSVSSSWTQPAVNCATTPNSFSAFWVGIDGDTSRTVEQTGTEANCSGGIPSYAAWYEMFPKRPVNYPNPVVPGDSFSAAVTALGKGRFQLTLTDATQGWSQSLLQKRRSARLASAEVIAEAPSSRRGVLPLSDFSSIGFTAAVVNGSLLSAATPGIEPVTMQSGATVKATPSAISAGAFSVTWRHE